MKKILLVSLLLLVVFSCKKEEDDIVSPDREYSPRVIQETYGNAKLVGFVNDKNGNPLADVTVFFGEEKTTTGSDGSYQLNTLSAGSNKRIWFEKDGYASTQKLADISEELPNRIDASLFPIGKTMKMTSDGGKIETENFSVEIEPGRFVYSDGTLVEEDVIVEATAFLATDDELLNAFPGEFRGTRTDGSTTAIESFGFIDVELKVETGEPVQLADGVNAKIKIKAPNNAPSSIPMWHYDEDKAKWIEEGVGKLNEGFYTADVSHFTKWNWDRPYDETSKIVGRVIDSDGNPIEGASVVQKGITYRFQNSTKTNEDGKFELLAPESNESEIKVLFDIYGSTVVNFITSPTKGFSNNIGDIEISISKENVIPPYITVDVQYVTEGETAKIRGNYFGEEKRTGYKLLLNGNEVETKTWGNDLIEFDVPIGIPLEGTIQIDRDGAYSRVIKYEEGEWTCEIDGMLYDNNYLINFSGSFKLSIPRGELVRIPDCIGNLQNLNVLLLNNNKLISLPTSIVNLKNLNKLEVNYNKINSLPYNINELSELKELNVIGNKLTALPLSIGNLLKLDTLNISENQISSLPENIGNINSLQTFNLERNQLITLPNSFGNLQSLEVLILRNNQLISLPKSFENLQNLHYLSLSSNKLNSLPESFSNFQNLSTFYIYRNRLTTLPESFGNLSNLKIFAAKNNELAKLPSSIGQLHNLYRLRLDSNKLTTLPESFGELQNLQELILDFNQLKALPESIGNLQNLREMNLSYNQLTTLPESIKGVKDNLILLVLYGNNFSKEEKEKIEGWLPDTHIQW